MEDNKFNRDNAGEEIKGEAIDLAEKMSAENIGTADKKPEKKLSVAFIILTILFPVAGLAYWLINKGKNPERANAYCTFAAFSTIISTVVGIFTLASRVTNIVGFIMSLFAA